MLFSVLSQTFEQLKIGLKPLLRLSLITLMLPGFVLGVFFRSYSHDVVTSIRELTDKMAAGSVATDYLALLEIARGFITLYLPLALLFIALLIAMYIVSTLLAFENLDYYKVEHNNLKELFFKALKVSFPKAYLIMLVAYFVGGQFGIMRIFGVLLLMRLT